MTKKKYSFLFAGCLLLGSLLGQQGDIIPFTSDQWTFQFENYEIVAYRGQTSLHFTGQNNKAFLAAADFEDGTFEFDVALPNKRTFLGFTFRMADPANYEEFYFRPHQSGNPDANQYSPVYNGLNGWQLYTGPGYAEPLDYHFDDWTHVKVVVSGSRAEIYLNGVSQPAIHLPFLHREPLAGGLGVWGRDGYFTNFRFTKANAPKLINKAVERPGMAPNTVTQWQVSTPFANSLLANQTSLSQFAKGELSWTTLTSEPSGTTNLAQLSAPNQESNTVFTRLLIEADQDQVKAFHFGYSDVAKVFLNDQALYEGQYTFRSRDYRFLGTIGYFDTVFLPLKKGTNELWVAVSENFGGWAIQGRFDDLEGIKLK